jgi:hypothetical protein
MSTLTAIELEVERILLAVERDWEEQMLRLATSSASLPDIPNKPGKTNWVEKAGGLPKYIERIAKHLHSEKGMTVSRAIATAVNTVKRWCAGGQTAEGGSSTVSAKTKALACKAVAQWEAKKAKSGVNASQFTGSRRRAEGQRQTPKLRYVSREGIILSTEDHDFIEGYGRLMLAAVENGDRFDSSLYLSELHEARLSLAITTFDPNEHPRDFKGRFKSIVAGLKKGQTVQLPDGVTVKKSINDENRFSVRPPDSAGRGVSFPMVESPDKAADAALDYSAKSKKDGSVGGARQWPNAKAVEDDNKRGEDMTKDVIAQTKKDQRTAKSKRGASERTERDKDVPQPDEEERADQLKPGEEADTDTEPDWAIPSDPNKREERKPDAVAVAQTELESSGFHKNMVESTEGVDVYMTDADYEGEGHGFADSIEVVQNDDGTFDLLPFREFVDETGARADSPDPAEAEPRQDIPASEVQKHLRELIKELGIA